MLFDGFQRGMLLFFVGAGRMLRCLHNRMRTAHSDTPLMFYNICVPQLVQFEIDSACMDNRWRNYLSTFEW